MNDFKVGQRVSTPQGPGTVTYVFGTGVTVKLDSGRTEIFQYYDVHAKTVKSIQKHVSTGRLVEQHGDRFTFAVSTAAPDRDNDTVDQKSLRWESFDINPTATLSHDTEVIPVGKWLPETRRITSIMDPESGEQVEATLMDFVPNPHTQAGRETGKSVADDFLGGASISFLPDEDGTEKNLHGGQHYEGARVTEVAVCAVPANQGATRRAAMLCKSLGAKRTKTMTIKFWRHKVQKSRVRVLRKDLPAFAAYTPEDDEHKVDNIEPVDEEPKAEDMGEWAAEEMEEPEHKVNEVDPALLAAFSRGEADRKAGKPRSTNEQYQAAYDQGYDGKSKTEEESTPKTEDYAEQVQSRAEELGGDEEMAWDDAVDAAMEEEQVPTEMRRAVKALAKKKRGKVSKAEKPVCPNCGQWQYPTPRGYQDCMNECAKRGLAPKVPNPAKPGEGGKELTPGESETKDAMQDCVSRKIEILRNEGKDEEQAAAIAYSMCGEKALKRGVTQKTLDKIKPHVLKAVKKADDSVEGLAEPHGLKTLKGWHQAISEGMKTLHEAEHPGVMEAGKKALSHFSKVAQKDYNFALGGDDAPTEEPDEEPEAKNMEPTEIDGKWTIYDPTNDEYIGEFLSQEEAQHGITDMANPDKPTALAAKCKEWKRRKANRRTVAKVLNKAQKGTITDAVEFMDGCSESKDLPKHMKSGHKHHAMALKELIAEKAEEAEEKMDDADTENLCKQLQSFDERMENLDRQLYRHFGRQYRKEVN